MTGEDGGIINDAVLLRLQPDQFWISPGDSDCLLWIQGAAINSGMNVNVFEPDASPLQIGGPKALGPPICKGDASGSKTFTFIPELIAAP